MRASERLTDCMTRRIQTSALAGLVRPGLQVQLRNGVTPLWTGVLDSIPTQYALNGQHRAQITAYGVLV